MTEGYTKLRTGTGLDSITDQTIIMRARRYRGELLPCLVVPSTHLLPLYFFVYHQALPPSSLLSLSPSAHLEQFVTCVALGRASERTGRRAETIHVKSLRHDVTSSCRSKHTRAHPHTHTMFRQQWGSDYVSHIRQKKRGPRFMAKSRGIHIKDEENFTSALCHSAVVYGSLSFDLMLRGGPYRHGRFRRIHHSE